MKVSELMSGSVVAVDVSASCQHALSRMHGARLRHLPVVDARGALVGIVTDRDLRHRLFRPETWQQVGSVPVETLLARIPVAEVMSTPVVTAQAADDLEDAARRMLEDKVGSLPVLDGERLVGIVTETDLLRRLVKSDAARPPAAVADVIVSYP